MPKVLGVERGSESCTDKLVKKQGLYIPNRKFDIAYYVLGDDLNTTIDEVLNTVGVPAEGSPQQGAYCVSRSTEVIDTVVHPTTAVSCNLYKVKCDFDSEYDTSKKEGGQNDDPKAQRPTVKWTGELEEYDLQWDQRTGEPVQTDNREPMIVVATRPIAVLEVSRLETWPFDPDVILDYVGKTNLVPFYGAPEGVALMMPMEAVDEEVEDELYSRVTYRIKFKFVRKIDPSGGVDLGLLEDPWSAHVLHEGTKVRLADGTIEQKKDKNGSPLTVNLKKDGYELLETEFPQFKIFHTSAQIDFNNLSLGPF